MKAKWVVDIKGEAESKIFEISVLRDDNNHGKLSYGWFDENKLLITHNGGPCDWPLKQIVWDKSVKLAQEVADELNLSEFGHICNSFCGEKECNIYQEINPKICKRLN